MGDQRRPPRHHRVETLGNPVFTPRRTPVRDLAAPPPATSTPASSSSSTPTPAPRSARWRRTSRALSTLTVDPLSGDLFFNDQCFGAGPLHAHVYRVRNPAAAMPTVEPYATLPTTPSWARRSSPRTARSTPSAGYLDAYLVVRVSGTDAASPGTVTPLTGVTSICTCSPSVRSAPTGMPAHWWSAPATT